jgi:lipoprotein signal peptidase
MSHLSNKALYIGILALGWIVFHEFLVQQLQALGVPVVATTKAIIVVPGITGWIIAGVVLGLVTYRLVHVRKSALWLGLLWGGYLSNVISYLRHGGVEDYIPLGSWLINLSDIIICISLVVLTLAYYKQKTAE